MEGITILAQEEILNVNAIGAFVAFIGLTLLGFLLGVFLSYHCTDDFLVAPCTVLGFLIGLIIFIYTMENGEPTGTYKYRVTIDETVSMTEFYERYEIVNQDGLIYEIKERETE